MSDEEKAAIYLEYLDKILAGDNEIGHVEDAEILKLLQLARKMMDADFSADSKIREDLRKKFVEKLNESNKAALSAPSIKDEDELDEDVLANVSAAAGEREKEICPYCGSMVSRLTGKCIFCNH